MIDIDPAPMGAPIRVLTRSEHGISRQQISNAALRVLYGLKDAGFAAYLVGGGVRDLLLGQQPKDFDIATNATPEQISRLFRTCRLIGRRFVIAHVRFGQEIIEVTTFRGSGAEGAANGDRFVESDGRILRDNVFGSIEEDAARRDFTVNAMYYSIMDFSVTDFAGGLDDLQRRQIALIGDHEKRYREDPVRMLRAARLAAKLDFRIEAQTEHWIGELKALLHDIPPARLFDEVLKLFLNGDGEKSWNELARLDLLSVLFPGLARANLAKHQAFMRAALASSDARVRADKAVSPGFLFAVLGWPLLHAKMPPGASADQRSAAIDSVMLQLSQIVALPRRFAIQVREIWEMLPRLFDANASRARRLLINPRFRAAYDFLLLLSNADAALLPIAEKWTQAQQTDADIDRLFALTKSSKAARTGDASADDDSDATDATAAPKRKRRRSRHRSKKPAAMS
jgi:poly(A) polymerase